MVEDMNMLNILSHLGTVEDMNMLNILMSEETFIQGLQVILKQML